MDKQTLAHQIGQAGGRLMRLERDLGRAKGDLSDATRNLIAGGVVLLIGIIALIGFFLLDSQLVGVIAAAGVLIGGLMVILALVKTRRAQRSIGATAGKVANARVELDELEAQVSVAE